jgi:RNA polymerase sigma factor (TIGR02999 family)
MDHRAGEEHCGEVTALLTQLSRGDQEAADKLIPLVYKELHRLAEAYMRRERIGYTLHPTALVHEAFIKLVQHHSIDWQSRAHFFGIAAQVMRRIFVDHARGHLREKRGGVQRPVAVDETLAEMLTTLPTEGVRNSSGLTARLGNPIVFRPRLWHSACLLN